MTDLPHKEIRSRSGARGYELEPEVLNRRDDIVTFLRTRRSTVAADITGPGPTEQQLAHMLEAACRVPDHGKLTPWRFIVLRGKGKARFTAFLEECWRAQHPGAENGNDAPVPEAAFLATVPLVVVVVARAVEHPKIPQWEQWLSAGAACHNLLLAAQAMGLAAQWRTGWPAYDQRVTEWLGLGPGERIAGIVHIGQRRPDAPPLTDRLRPYWRDLATFPGEEDDAP